MIPNRKESTVITTKTLAVSLVLGAITAIGLTLSTEVATASVDPAGNYDPQNVRTTEIDPRNRELSVSPLTEHVAATLDSRELHMVVDNRELSVLPNGTRINF